jgi:hypothetical protein
MMRLGQYHIFELDTINIYSVQYLRGASLLLDLYTHS